MTLMEKLEAAGYPREEMYHHELDLYVFITPLTKRVIDEWLQEEGLTRNLFVSIFRDQITGKPMYDVAFQYASALNSVSTNMNVNSLRIMKECGVAVSEG